MLTSTVVSILAVALVSLLKVVTGEQDPWMPDLTCHPSYQEHSFVSEGEQRKGFVYYRELAKGCKGYSRGDPCLTNCILERWGMVNIPVSKEEVMQALDDTQFESERVQLSNEQFFKDVFQDVAYSEQLMIRLEKLCGRHDYVSTTFYFFGGPSYPDWTCSNHPGLFECVERVLDCSNQNFPAYLPLQYFDLSCHSNYIHNNSTNVITWPEISLDLLGMVHFAETACEWFYNIQYQAVNEQCILGCIFSGDEYQDPLVAYNEAVLINDPKKKNLAIKELALYLPNFESNGKSPGIGALHVAQKLMENCAKLVNPNISPATCNMQKNEYWDTLGNCLIDVIKCRL